MIARSRHEQKKNDRGVVGVPAFNVQLPSEDVLDLFKRSCLFIIYDRE